MEIAAYFWMEPPTQKPADNPVNVYSCITNAEM